MLSFLLLFVTYFCEGHGNVNSLNGCNLASDGGFQLRRALDQIQLRGFHFTSAFLCAHFVKCVRVRTMLRRHPFFDPELADRLIELAQEHDLDIATNVFPRSYPVGTSIEVIATRVMRRGVE